MKKKILMIALLIMTLSLVACNNKDEQTLQFKEVIIGGPGTKASEFIYIDSFSLIEMGVPELNGVDLSSYDDEFFKDRAFIVFTYRLTSSEKNIKVSEIRLDGNILMVNMVFDKPGDFYTEDLGARNFLIELEKNIINEVHLFPYNIANQRYESYYNGSRAILYKKGA